MRSETEAPVLKTVGSSGQISIGKAYAGKTLRVTVQSDGTMLLTPVVVVPEHQLWTVQEPHRTAIARGMAHAAAQRSQGVHAHALVGSTQARIFVGGSGLPLRRSPRTDRRRAGQGPDRAIPPPSRTVA